MDLEKKLAFAHARLDAASAALAPKHKGGEWEEYRAAHEALLVAERELAASRNEEYAVPLEFPVEWDVRAPLPQLLVNDRRAFLIFVVKTVDPNWDGTYVRVKDPSAGEKEQLALVEFKRCTSAKLGAPNDEVFHGHPLSGKGLDSYTAQLVRNSRWLAELQRINSVHRMYRAERWQTCNHYVFWFHDSTFECIAESFVVEVHEGTFSELLAEACKRLLG